LSTGFAGQHPQQLWKNPTAQTTMPPEGGIASLQQA
jgi:hypothetical protein